MNQENQVASTVAAKINNQELVIISENANKFVPIKPICDALGIDYPTQYQKLKEDEDLAPTMGLRPMIAADNKQREMVCLPLEYIFGWLFTISPKNVAPEAKESVRRYRIECYKALFDHFSERSSFIEEKQQRLIEQSDIVMAAQEAFNQSKEQLKEAKKQYDMIKVIDFEQWKNDKRQLKRGCKLNCVIFIFDSTVGDRPSAKGVHQHSRRA